MPLEVSSNSIPEIQSLFNLLPKVKGCDRSRLKNKLLNAKKLNEGDKKDNALILVSKLSVFWNRPSILSNGQAFNSFSSASVTAAELRCSEFR